MTNIRWPQRCYNKVRLMNAPSPVNVRRLDAGIMPMLRSMEDTGIGLDVAALDRLDAELADEQSDLLNQIESHREPNGRQYNLNSGKQLSELLFGELGLSDDGLKRVKDNSRAKLDKKVIATLKDKHEIVSLYEQWKERQTLRDTFCRKLPRNVYPDGKIHPTFLSTRVATGRLACKNPNLMQIPTRSEQGREIRNAFRPPDGMEFFSIDQSQIELRIVADQSRDPTMIGQFLSGTVDFHTQTAANVFKIPIDQVHPKRHRSPAKNMNFGVVYGITAQGLLKQFISSGAMDWTLEECEELIRKWFSIYPSIRDYMDLQVRRAKAHGYVWDMWGRVRLFPEIHSAHRHIKEAAEREVGNTNIQSGAQGCMKLAMAQLEALRTEIFMDKAPLPLIQIHDELVFAIYPDIIEEFTELAGAVMESCVELAVPIQWSASHGPLWGELK